MIFTEFEQYADGGQMAVACQCSQGLAGGGWMSLAGVARRLRCVKVHQTELLFLPS
jgi:hypothetical protein